uniref:PDZ domain-containing protein n=1 Tax=Pundamilia nyererei TaxID=303518 RepID=A0A3B4HC37_9CICH
PVPSLHSGPSSGFTFPGNLYFNVSIVRGGSEHGVGIYVSLVEPGSSAEREGLRVGDQIVAANDILFDNVTHIEAVKVGLHANAGVYECDCCGVCTAGFVTSQDEIRAKCSIECAGSSLTSRVVSVCLTLDSFDYTISVAVTYSVMATTPMDVDENNLYAIEN